MKNNLLWFAGAGVAFGLLYLLGVNRNLFFLAFALSLAGLAIAASSRWSIRLASVAMLLGLASVTVSAPLPPRVDVHKGYANGIRDIPAGQRLKFRFVLTDIERRRKECGSLEAYVVVTGANLGTLDISVNSEPPTITALLKASPFHDLVRAYIPADIASPVDLVLETKYPIGLFRGPEVAGDTAYPDAVFLAFGNRKCRVVYHARLSTDP